MKRRLRKLTKTCDFCPSQWDGELEDGSPVYIRYRWGYLAVRPHPGSPESERLYGKQVGDDYEGVMSTEEMLKETGLELLPGVKVDRQWKLFRAEAGGSDG